MWQPIMSACWQPQTIKTIRNCNKNTVRIMPEQERGGTKIDTALNSSSKTMLFSSSKPGSRLINHPLCVRCHVCDLHGAPWWGRGGGCSSAYLQTQVWLPAPRVGMSTRADWRNGGEERSVRGAEDGGAEVMTSAKWKTGTMGNKKKEKKRKTNLSSGSRPQNVRKRRGEPQRAQINLLYKAGALC